tara:strand:+ start:1970 stop:3274 length:1305 start_codon:yes stop_codon:yes gene_type:complete
MLWLNFSKIQEEEYNSAFENINTYNSLPKLSIPTDITDTQLKQFVKNIVKMNSQANIALIIKLTDLIHYFRLCKMNERDLKFIKRLLKDKNIRAAHKADGIRFLLLKYLGGIWIDMTIVCMVPLKTIVNSNSFCMPYMPLDFGLKLIFLSNVSQYFKDIGMRLFELDEANIWLHVLPENYFISAQARDKIVTNVLEELIIAWNFVWFNIQSSNVSVALTLQYDKWLAKYLKSITEKNLFKFSADVTNAYTYDQEILELWQPSVYLFNYIQIWITLNNLCKTNVLTIEETGVLKGCYNFKISKRLNEFGYPDTLIDDILHKLQIKREFRDFVQSMCNSGGCEDILLMKWDWKYSIKLISSQYLRLYRFIPRSGDQRYSTSKHSFLDTLINSQISCNEFIDVLKKLEVYFIKFSSKTRNTPLCKELIKTIANCEKK